MNLQIGNEFVPGQRSCPYWFRRKIATSIEESNVISLADVIGWKSTESDSDCMDSELVADSTEKRREAFGSIFSN